MMKTYGEMGVPLDANFASHVALCERCAAVDVANAKSLQTLCLEGSALWKRENVTAAERVNKRGLAPDTVVSRDEAKRAMKYKE